MNKQKGFSAVALLLFILVIGVIGFAGYYVYNQQNTSQVNPNLTTYCNNKSKACFDYPKQWRLDYIYPPMYDPDVDMIRITTNNGNVIHYYSPYGTDRVCDYNEYSAQKGYSVDLTFSKKVGSIKGQVYSITTHTNTNKDEVSKSTAIALTNVLPKTLKVGTHPMCDFYSSPLSEIKQNGSPSVGFYSFINSDADTNDIITMMESYRFQQNTSLSSSSVPSQDISNNPEDYIYFAEMGIKVPKKNLHNEIEYIDNSKDGYILLNSKYLINDVKQEIINVGKSNTLTSVNNAYLQNPKVANYIIDDCKQGSAGRIYKFNKTDIGYRSNQLSREDIYRYLGYAYATDMGDYYIVYDNQVELEICSNMQNENIQKYKTDPINAAKIFFNSITAI